MSTDSSTQDYKSSYKGKIGQKVRTAHQTLDVNHTQKIWHPCGILESTSLLEDSFQEAHQTPSLKPESQKFETK